MCTCFVKTPAHIPVTTVHQNCSVRTQVHFFLFFPFALFGYLNTLPVSLSYLTGRSGEAVRIDSFARARLNIIWWWVPLSRPHGVTTVDHVRVSSLLYAAARRCTFRLPVEAVSSHLNRATLVHATTILCVIVHRHLYSFTSNLRSATISTLAVGGPRMRLLHRLQRQFPRHPPGGLGLFDDANLFGAAERIPVAGAAVAALFPPSPSSPLDLELLPLSVLAVIRL